MPIKNKHGFILLAVLFLTGALAVRFVHLEQRPMHGDEAVNAWKLDQVLKDTVFAYDPAEYHGPALYYISWFFSTLEGNDSIREMTETDLRLVPALFGIGLPLLWLLFAGYMRKEILLSGLVLLGFSAPLVFYSRYYIHEMLYVFFLYLTLFLLFRYRRHSSAPVALLTGMSVGLVVSTKETWLISLPALIFSFVVVLFTERTNNNILRKTAPGRIAGHACLGLAGMILVTVLFYSSGFRDMDGLTNFIRSVPTYLSRGTGSAVHDHPWYQYFSWLFFHRETGGLIRTEVIALILAFAGLLSIRAGKAEDESDNDIWLLTGLFSLIQLVVFSILPYKTPWNVLAFYPGILMLAAPGAIWMYSRVRNRIVRIIVSLVLTIGLVHFVWQSYVLNFVYESSTRNPWVYAHPLPDLLQLTDRLEGLAEVMPEGKDIPVQVIVPGDDYWPLPWYLRKFSRVGWLSGIPETGMPAPVIITSSEMDESVTRFIYERPPPGQKNLYVPLFERDVPFRPQKFLNAYIRYDLMQGEAVDERL